jgi:hypothetical protein
MVTRSPGRNPEPCSVTVPPTATSWADALPTRSPVDAAVVLGASG